MGWLVVGTSLAELWSSQVHGDHLAPEGVPREPVRVNALASRPGAGQNNGHMWERPQAWDQGQGSGWAGRSVVNRALRRREKRRARAHGLRVNVPAGRLRGEPSLARWLRSWAAPLQGHAAPWASPLSAHAGQTGRRRGALLMRGRNSKPVCAACPRPSLIERGLEGAQSCPLRWRGHLDPGGAPPVVGDTGWPWAPRPPACPGLGA